MNAIPRPALATTDFDPVVLGLHHWLRARDYAGHEPYDLLNSPYLRAWATHQPFATLFIQGGKRFGGLALRRALDVPASQNPKALALILSAYCDLIRSGWNCLSHAKRVREMLLSLRSPDEHDFCWGYDWHYVSLRGARMPAFAPNSVVTVFCAHAFLDFAELYGDAESFRIARSAARWLATQLNRSVDTARHLCLSYTPADHTEIFNNNALAGALFARIGDAEFESDARRIMQFLADGQAPDGSWNYGRARTQRWIDSFHTGYNLCALFEYQNCTGNRSFDLHLQRGYEFYRQSLFRPDGAPRYFASRDYPVDVHACSQAILTFCTFARQDPDALNQARKITDWTVANLRNQDGSFGYQIHERRTDRTPYLRWSQAWMLRALAQLRSTEIESQ